MLKNITWSAYNVQLIFYAQLSIVDKIEIFEIFSLVSLAPTLLVVKKI